MKRRSKGKGMEGETEEEQQREMDEVRGRDVEKMWERNKQRGKELQFNIPGPAELR